MAFCVAVVGLAVVTGSGLGLSACGDEIVGAETAGAEIVGVTVTPHQFSPNMQWRRPPDPELAARVEVFLRNNSDQTQRLAPPFLFDGQSPDELIAARAWAWHDTAAADGIELPAGALRVLRWNGMNSQWGVETSHRFQSQWQADATSKPLELTVDLPNPATWIQSITFHRRESTDTLPTRMIATIRNASKETLRVRSVRLWLPQSNDTYHTLFPQDVRTDFQSYSANGEIGPDDWGTIELDYAPLPLTYAAVEIELTGSANGDSQRLWGSLKIRPAAFDISGGWIANVEKGQQTLLDERYLKTLARLHVNTGQIEEVAGYTDRPEVYARFPLKRFNRLGDRARYDQESMLSGIHAVEFLGEPQYGGGRPVPPQEVFDQLAPYRPWRLPTSVTLSEERTWRYYAGLSDYPHYDAYRVIAPAADAWSKYDRWGGTSVRWGAPLETIGDMTRSLREQSRPVSIAYWSQGAHHDWGGILSPRRGSPTPDELRSQAWHGLGNGIASLYWFNLSAKSLVKFPDLIEPIAQVGREIQLLRPLLEEGASYRWQAGKAVSQHAWDQTSLTTRESALLCVHDLEYAIDERTRTFHFAPREGEFAFELPVWLDRGTSCFRVDGAGTHDVAHSIEGRRVRIQDRVQVVGIYIVTRDPGLRARLDAQARALDQREAELGFDPVHRAEDMKALRALVD